MDQMRKCLEGFVKSLLHEYNQMKLTDGKGRGRLALDPAGCHSSSNLISKSCRPHQQASRNIDCGSVQR